MLAEILFIYLLFIFERFFFSLQKGTFFSTREKDLKRFFLFQKNKLCYQDGKRIGFPIKKIPPKNKGNYPLENYKHNGNTPKGMFTFSFIFFVLLFLFLLFLYVSQNFFFLS